MNSSKVFWGTFFIVVGALFLVQNFSVTGIWIGDLYDYWPLLLVLIGLAVMIKNDAVKNVLSGAGGVFLGLIVFSVVTQPSWNCHGPGPWNWSNNTDNDKDWGDRVENYMEPYDSTIEYVDFSFTGGAGEFKLSGDTQHLFSLVSRGAERSMTVSIDKQDSLATADIRMENYKFDFDEDHPHSRMNLGLHPDPVYNLTFKMGAAEADFDFSGLKVDKLELETGASDTEIRLDEPPDNETVVYIEVGAAALVLELPGSVGAQIDSEAALSATDYDGFEEKENGFWQTPDFDSSEKRILINISSGISSLEIRRY